MTIETLAHLWLKAKEAEALATEMRRELEDTMHDRLFSDAPSEGMTTREIGPYQIRVTERLSKQVDVEKLQALAEEAGLTDHLGALFRWRPEVCMSAWRDAHADITKPLEGAISTKRGRPSFLITVKE